MASACAQLIAKIFPEQQAVNKVVEKAERFWEGSPDLYIGIHCAYGETFSTPIRD